MSEPAAAAPVSIVTGAGSGMGRATALRLAAKGHRLVLVGRTLAKLVDAAREIVAGHPGTLVETIEADVGDPAAVHSIVPRVVTTFGRIDLLVNAAGVAPLVPIEATGSSSMWGQEPTTSTPASRARCRSFRPSAPSGPTSAIPT